MQRKKIKKVSVSAAPPTVADTSGEQAASIALRQSLQAGASEVFNLSNMFFIIAASQRLQRLII